MSMTIAEALREVADIKGRFDEWKDRLQPAVMYNGSDPPAFEMDAVVGTLNKLVKRMVELQTAIAVANATALVEWDGRDVPLAMAVRTLSELRGTIKRVDALAVRNQRAGTDQKTEFSYDDDGKRVRVKVDTEWTCKLTTAAKVALKEKLEDRERALNEAIERVNRKTLIVEAEGLPDAAM